VPVRFGVIPGIRHKLLVITILAAVSALNALAQTDEIQVYDAEIAAPGKFNLMLHNNFTPDGRDAPAFHGAIIADKSLNGVPEWAYGVTDWFEQGLYLPLYSISKNRGATLDGFKLRELFVAPRLKTIGRVLVGGVVLERLSSSGRILVASGEAKERFRTKSRVVGTGGEAEKSSTSSLSRISAGIGSVRCRSNRLCFESDSRETDQREKYGSCCFHRRGVSENLHALSRLKKRSPRCLPWLASTLY
jgi:hypothetical protein